MNLMQSWPYKAATLVAVAIGGMLLLGGWGHLSAILDSRAGQPFDYRFVSLITTSGILMFPGLVSIAMAFWLWRGRSWAYISCLLSISALSLYLGLLIYMKAKVPDAATAAGDEVYIFSGLVGFYLLVLVATLIWQQGSRGRQPTPA